MPTVNDLTFLAIAALPGVRTWILCMAAAVWETAILPCTGLPHLSLLFIGFAFLAGSASFGLHQPVDDAKSLTVLRAPIKYQLPKQVTSPRAIRNIESASALNQLLR